MYTLQNKFKELTTMENIKWRAISGLTIVFLAVAFNQNWLWGVLFLLWVIPDLKRGVTHFLEVIDRRQNAIIFWLIQITWISLSIYLIWFDLLIYYIP